MARCWESRKIHLRRPGLSIRTNSPSNNFPKTSSKKKCQNHSNTTLSTKKHILKTTLKRKHHHNTPPTKTPSPRQAPKRPALLVASGPRPCATLYGAARPRVLQREPEAQRKRSRAFRRRSSEEKLQERSKQHLPTTGVVFFGGFFMVFL